MNAGTLQLISIIAFSLAGVLTLISIYLFLKMDVLGHRRAVGFQFARGDGEEIIGEAAALARKVGGRKSGPGDDRNGPGGGLLQLLFGRLGLRRGARYDPAQFLARPRHRQRVLVLLLEQLAAERKDAVADVPFAALVDALLHELREPAPHRRCSRACKVRCP